VTAPGHPGEPADDDLSDLLDEAALDAAARARRAAREGRDRARELATWVGTLRDLVERAAVVQVRTVTATTPTGTLVGVAADHLVLRLRGGGLAVVARAATTGVQVVDGPARAAPAAGDRRAPTDRALLEVLDRWREDGAEVHLTARGGATERGRIETVGEDVLSLTSSAGTVHLPADAIVSVTVR
jgi:hypothetical protein